MPETQFRHKGVVRTQPRIVVEFTDFEWNKKLDHKLFKVPEDYTFKEQHKGPAERTE